MRWTATRRPNLTFDQKQKFWPSHTSQRSLSLKEKILGPLSFQISLQICVRRIRTDSVDLQMRWTATKRPHSTFYCPKGLLCRDPSNFPVRPSSVCLSVRLSSVCHTQFWTRILRNMHAWNSIRVQNRVRLGHFAKHGSYEDNPSVALDHSRLSGDFATWV